MVFKLLKNKDVDKGKVLSNLNLPSDYDVEQLGIVRIEYIIKQISRPITSYWLY